jgi:hypothetical protein
VRAALPLALLLGLDACSSYRVPSIGTLDRADRSLVAYRVAYAIGGEWPPPSSAIEVLVVRKNGTARIDAMVSVRSETGNEVGELGVRLDSRHASRTLSEAEWSRLAGCWEAESMFWSTPDLTGFAELASRPIGTGYQVISIEGVRDGQYHRIESHRMFVGEHPFTGRRLLECARNTILAGGIVPYLPGWWSRLDEKPCDDLALQPLPANKEMPRALRRYLLRARDDRRAGKLVRGRGTAAHI